MAALSGLRELVWEHSSDEHGEGQHASHLDADHLDAALRPLTALTRLELCISAPMGPWLRRWPGEALAGMEGLQRLSLNAWVEGDRRLPPGPWLASLRHLGVQCDTAAASLDVLAAATRLTSLWLLGIDPGDEEAALGCGSLEPLQQLVLQSYKSELTDRLAAELARRRPTLAVKCACWRCDLSS